MSSNSWAAIALVHESSGGDFSGTNFTSMATAALTTTSGNLIVATTAYIGLSDAEASSVTDTAGNTYFNGSGCTNFNSNAGTEVWYAKNITGNASNVLTFHYKSGGPQYVGVTQIEYSGADANSPFEVCASGSASGTSVTSGAFSPASSGNVNVATAEGSGGATTWSAGAGYITVDATNNYSEHLLNAAAGSQTASANSTSSLTLGLTVASFKVTPNVAIIQNATIKNATIN